MIISHAKVGERSVESMQWNNQMLYSYSLTFPEKYTWTYPFPSNGQEDAISLKYAKKSLNLWYFTATPDVFYLGNINAVASPREIYDYIILKVPPKTQVSFMPKDGVYKGASGTFYNWAAFMFYCTETKPVTFPSWSAVYNNSLPSDIFWHRETIISGTEPKTIIPNTSSTIITNNTNELKTYYFVYGLSAQYFNTNSFVGFQSFEFTSSILDEGDDIIE